MRAAVARSGRRHAHVGKAPHAAGVARRIVTTYC